MRISLRFVSTVNSGIERLESLRWVMAVLCCVMLVGQSVTMLHFVPLASGSMWLWTLIQWLGLLALVLQFRRRRSLRWQANHLLSASREPGVIVVSKLFKNVITFKSLSSVFSLWFIWALLIFPFYVRPPSLGFLNYSRLVLDNARPDFFGSLWQVHATVLGVFLVILTFVFQFVSLRSAYETSLLPFLAQRVHLAPIIIINFCFVALEILPSLLKSAGALLLFIKYLSALGFFFSAFSAIYLLLRVLDLLRPEVLEESLDELVRRDMMKELEEEYFLDIASVLLKGKCSAWGIEFTEIDFFKNLPSIRSDVVGTIADIDLHKLEKFCKNLKVALPLTGAPVRKASLVRMLTEELTEYENVLARVSAADLTERNARLLRKAFRIERYDDR